MESKPSKPVTISKLVRGLPRLKNHEEELELIESEASTWVPKYDCVDKSSFIGIEVEVENVRNIEHPLTPYWEIKEDGSLRNRGREFVSIPLRAFRAERALSLLFSSLNKDIDFSERTSIHIHLNVRTFTYEQIETFLLTYILFEKVLFSFISPSRYENIFCVPICETYYGKLVKRSLAGKNPNFGWSKYTALNLIPILDKGTVEFRHLQGTRDIKTIMDWINIILCIKKFAFRNTPEYIKERIYTLNSSSQYQDLANEVFGPYIRPLLCDNFNSLVEECDSFIKEQCFINPFEDKVKKIHPESALSEFYNSSFANVMYTGTTTLNLRRQSTTPPITTRDEFLQQVRGLQTNSNIGAFIDSFSNTVVLSPEQAQQIRTEDF